MYARLTKHLDYVQKMMPEWVKWTEEQKNLIAQHQLDLSAQTVFSELTADWEKLRPVWMANLLSTLTEKQGDQMWLFYSQKWLFLG